jgi:hypothetical protein
MAALKALLETLAVLLHQVKLNMNKELREILRKITIKSKQLNAMKGK